MKHGAGTLLRLLAVGLGAVALTIPPTAAGKANDSFVGAWRAIDFDGSEMAFFISAPVDGTFLVEGYDHGATVCGVMGDTTPGLPPGVDPVKPARYATGFGILDENERLVVLGSGIVCLDAILGPYRHPAGMGHFVFSYKTTDDVLVDRSSEDPDYWVVYQRMKYATVEEFREGLAKGK
jgi:hypothetical protein